MNLQNKQGAVAVYALLSIAVFTALVFSLYIVVNSRHKAQLQTAADIRREAEQNILDEEIEIIENPKEIFIYNEEHLQLKGTNDFVYIPEENKIYRFTDTATYIEDHFD